MACGALRILRPAVPDASRRRLESPQVRKDGQDIAVPLGIERPIPADAALEVAGHLWRMTFPMRPARRAEGLRLIATDAGSR